MSGALVQDLAAGALVALALAWLVRRGLRAARRGRGPECEHCAAAAPPPPGVRPAPTPELLIGIGEPPPRRD